MVASRGAKTGRGDCPVCGFDVYDPPTILTRPVLGDDQCGASVDTCI